MQIKMMKAMHFLKLVIVDLNPYKFALIHTENGIQVFLTSMAMEFLHFRCTYLQQRDTHFLLL